MPFSSIPEYNELEETGEAQLSVSSQPEEGGEGDLMMHLRSALDEGDTRIFTRMSARETMEQLAAIDTLYLDLDGTCLEQGATEFPPGFTEKLRKLQKAGTRIVFATGKPQTEIRALMSTIPSDITAKFMFERSAYRIDRTPENLDAAPTRLMATPETEEIAAQLHARIMDGTGSLLQQKHNVRIVPAGDGGHRSLVSIDILRADTPDDYINYPRYNLKVKDKAVLEAVKADLVEMLEEHYPHWSLTDLGNGNFEMHRDNQTKEEGILCTEEFHNSTGRCLAIDDSANGKGMLMLKHIHPKMMSAVVYNRHTSEDVVEHADIAIAGEAMVDQILQQIIEAKGIDERVIAISNTSPVKPEKGRVQMTVGGVAGGLATAIRSRENAQWLFLDQQPDLYADLEQEDPLISKLIPVGITPGQQDSHYVKISNQIFWKLMHPDAFKDIPHFPNIDWDNFMRVNANIVRRVIEAINGSGEPVVIWAHDFQVTAFAHFINKMYPHVKIKTGFFWHIPFADPDQYVDRMHSKEKGDFRARQQLEWFSQYGVVGFHVQKYADNYIKACKRLGVKPARNIMVQPISIDVDNAENLARAAMSADFRFDHPALDTIFGISGGTAQKTKVILGSMHRADPMKGDVPKLQAAVELARTQPELFEGKTWVEALTPSRTKDPEYKKCHDDCLRLIDEFNDVLDNREVMINAQSVLNRGKVFGIMARADYAMVPSIHDGYNMVALEILTAWNATRDMTDRRRSMFLTDTMGVAMSFREKGYADPSHIVQGPIAKDALKNAIAALLSDRLPEPRFDEISRYTSIYTTDAWIDRGIAEIRYSNPERLQEVRTSA